jgi:hypothetical protein
MDDSKNSDGLPFRIVPRSELNAELVESRPERDDIIGLEPNAKPKCRDCGVAPRFEELVAHGIHDRDGRPSVRGQPDAPRLAGRAIGPLQRAAFACADFLWLEKTCVDELANVVQDRARITPESFRDLLVGQRLVEREPQNSPAQWMPQSAHLLRRRVAFGRRFLLLACG